MTHLIDMVKNHNYAAGNIGVTLWTDVIIPVVLIVTYAYYRYLQKAS